MADGSVAVLLPLDQLFDIRVAAALRLWRGLTGRTPGPNLGILTPERRGRLILALRALDGRLERATYPEIAAVLLKKPLFDVIMLGGAVQRSSGGCVGATAISQVQGI